MTAAIILAAGESRRLGFPKQTLLYKGKTLLEWAIEAARKSKCDPVVVVLGANAEAIAPGIKDDAITIVQNNDWAEGMASSIRTAVEYIGNIPAIDGAVIQLCDQPFVNRALLDSMIYKQQETGKPIVACSYNGTIGVPVLFKRQLFTDLSALQGKEGAKKILDKNLEHIAVVPFEKGGTDIDTIADYERLVNSGD
jgi:molybdenum cofactor cytidylyltransferase